MMVMVYEREFEFCEKSFQGKREDDEGWEGRRERERERETYGWNKMRKDYFLNFSISFWEMITKNKKTSKVVKISVFFVRLKVFRTSEMLEQKFRTEAKIANEMKI